MVQNFIAYEEHQIKADRFSNPHQIKQNPNKAVRDDDLSSDDGYHGLSPPPPYDDEVLEYKDISQRRDSASTFSSVDGGSSVIAYNDVGEEINVTVPTNPYTKIGLTIISGQSFSPNWPAILDINHTSSAYTASPKIAIGDQIKEINGIPTETLTNDEILNLFSDSRGSVQLILRRGVEPTKRKFDWFKPPFLSVSRNTEEIAIITDHVSKKLQSYHSYDELYKDIHHQQLSTFKENQGGDFSEGKRFGDRKVQDGPHYKHVRSMSASAAYQGIFILRERQRRKTVQENSTTSNMFLTSSAEKNGKKSVGSKSIASEVEMRRHRSATNSSMKSSLNSLASSTTTISSYSSNSTSEIPNYGHSNYLMNTYIDVKRAGTPTDPYTENDDQIKTKSDHTEHFPNMIKAPVNKLRESFRKRSKNKTNSNEDDVILEQPYENTLTVTVWVPDRRRLGIKLGGGSVSPYGASNICIMEIKKTGTAHKLLRTGDEILEVDGKLTVGLDVYQVNSILKDLEGNYIELKIFRPSK